MKKIFALALVAVFCLAGYGVSAQTQSKNQKLSPKQEKREAREQRRAQRQADLQIEKTGRNCLFTVKRSVKCRKSTCQKLSGLMHPFG